MKQIGFAFGIRTVRSFSIEDKLGAIIDEILYSESSEFNSNLFPLVRENHNTKLLSNESSSNKFTITPQDFVFEYTIKSNFDSEFEKYLNAFKKTILDKVFTEFKIKNIARFGFIINSELREKDEFLSKISNIIEQHKGKDDSLSLRYNVITKKPIKIDKIVTEDYDNEIATYNRKNSTSPFVFTVDYQKYFKPELNILADSTVSFENFCRSSYSRFKEDYIKS